MKKATYSSCGFTLVELAVVLTIIGLLIGGVLKGQEILENSRVTTTIANLKSYQGATASFLDTFKGYPGDISTAQTVLANCSVGNSCANGDGNQMIGINPTYFWYVYVAESAENWNFWKHLAVAGMIKGVDPGTAPGGSPPTQAGLWPQSPLGVYFQAKSFTGRPSNAADYVPTGLSLTAHNTAGSYEALSPAVVSRIDRKVDDGIALSGSVYAVSAGWSSGCGSAGAGTQGVNGYNEQQATRTCSFGFHLGL